MYEIMKIHSPRIPYNSKVLLIDFVCEYHLKSIKILRLYLLLENFLIGLIYVICGITDLLNISKHLLTILYMCVCVCVCVCF